MNSPHYKSPFVFFSILVFVLLAGVGYLYFRNYTPNANVFWVDGSLKITTDWGGCAPTFPCYETYLLDQDGNIFYNQELKGRLSESKTKELIKKAYNIYKDNICTPAHEEKIKQNYEIKLDDKTFDFGGKQGCKEMQSTIDTLKENINK